MDKCPEGLKWCASEKSCVTSAAVDQGIFDCDSSVEAELKPQTVREIETSFDDELLSAGVDGGDSTAEEENAVEEETLYDDDGGDSVVNDPSVMDRIPGGYY